MTFRWSIRRVFVAPLIGLVLILAGCQSAATDQSSTGETADQPIKIAQVFQGTLGDESYNDAMWDANEQAQQDFGVSYDYVESWAYPDMEGYLRDYAEVQEYDLIIVGSFQIEWL